MIASESARDGDWILLHNPKSKRATQARDAIEGLALELSLERGVALWWVEISDLVNMDWNPKRIIAMGGDGTVNAAVSWIASRSATPRPHLAIVPAGTGNNFARDTGIPLDPVEAVKLAFSGEATRVLDLLQFTDLDSKQVVYALQSGSVGLPAVVAHRYDVLRRYRLFRWIATPFGQYVYRIIGALLLVNLMFKQTLGGRGLGATVRFEGETWEEEILALFINNERSLGGNFFPCPEANSSDGIVDLCLFVRGPAFHYPGLFRAVCKAEHVDRYDEVIYRQGRGKIEIELDRAMPLLIDGDLPIKPRRLSAELQPSFVSLTVPS